MITRLGADTARYTSAEWVDDVLQLDGQPVALAELQDEFEQIVQVVRDPGGQLHTTWQPGAVYVAEVVLPPRAYELIEGASPDAGEGMPEPEFILLPLDPDQVIVRLAPLPEEAL